MNCAGYLGGGSLDEVSALLSRASLGIAAVIVAAGGVVLLRRWGLSTKALVGPVAGVKPVGVQRYLKEAQDGTAQ